MSEEISANSHIPDWKEIRTKFLTSILVFVSGGFFAVTLFEIKGFIEDHGMVFENIEIIIILGFLIAFYVLSGIIFSMYSRIYNRAFPQKECQIDEKYQLMVSLLASIFYIIFVVVYWVPMLAPIEGAERNMLYWTVFWWLISIFILNILLNSSRVRKLLCSIKDKIQRGNPNE